MAARRVGGWQLGALHQPCLHAQLLLQLTEMVGPVTDDAMPLRTDVLLAWRVLDLAPFHGRADILVRGDVEEPRLRVVGLRRPVSGTLRMGTGPGFDPPFARRLTDSCDD